MRRLQRYSVAEGDLATKLQQCNAGPSSRELQIRALEKATSMLSVHAQNSHERADKLRNMLADHSMDPNVYEALKRERWMEEKRQSVVDLDTKVVLKQLETLLKSSDIDSVTPDSSPMTKEKRHNMNLVKFLSSSSAQPPIRISKYPLIFPERALKRRTLDRVSPMRLRTSSTASSSPNSHRHVRSISLEGRKRRLLQPIPDFGDGKMLTRMPRPSLNVVTENIDSHTDASSSSGSISLFESSSGSTHLDSPSTSAAVLTPQAASHIPLPGPSGSTKEFDNINGTVTIYFTQPYDPQVVNNEDIQVQLPEYALNLFSQFDVNYEVPQLPQSFATPSITPQTTPRPPPLSIPFLSSEPPAQRQHETNRKSLPVMPSPITPSTPSSSPKKLVTSPLKSSRLGRSSSHRQLGALFAIPEALGSTSGFFSKARYRNRDEGASSVTSLKLADNVEQKEKGDSTPKVKKRFSVLRLGRA